MAKLTPKQTKIVKAKVKAELENIPQAVLAPTLFPNATPESASVMLSRELNKVNVQEAIQLALEEHGITISKAIKPIADGLEATKIVTSHTEPDYDVPDHSVRLKASGMALKVLGVDNEAPTGNTFIYVAGEQKEKYGI